MNVTEIFPDIEIPHDELTFFNNNVLRVHLAAKDFFITQGIICNKIAFVETGQLQSVIVDGNNMYVVAQHLKDQFVSSFNSFFSREKSKLDIQALEPTTLVVVSYQLFIELCERHVCWSLFWLRILESKSLDLIEQEKSLSSFKNPTNNL
jgi:CRP-like cAMP-binding protein